MSREIKFRAWDGCAEKMIIAGLDDGYTFIKSECGFDVYGDDGMEIYHLELMQYTGIEDKNDVEIYEGDVVRVEMSKIYLGEVRFQHGSFRSYPHNFTLGGPIKERLEVIGNIHENPELLEALNESNQ